MRGVSVFARAGGPGAAHVQLCGEVELTETAVRADVPCARPLPPLRPPEGLSQGQEAELRLKRPWAPSTPQCRTWRACFSSGPTHDPWRPAAMRPGSFSRVTG